MIRMRLSTRPCLQKGLIFLMLLQLAFKVSLQEATEPNEGAPNKVDIQDLCLRMAKLENKRVHNEDVFSKIIKVLLDHDGVMGDRKIFKRAKGRFGKDQRGTFRGGQNECEDRLALPENKEENKVLQNLLKQNNGRAILGLSYDSAAKQFKNAKGQPVHFFNWAPGKPSDLKSKECVEMYPDGEWHNIDCEASQAIICEFDI